MKILSIFVAFSENTNFNFNPVFGKETFVSTMIPIIQILNGFFSLRVFFQCNSENVEPTSREDHVEPETGVRYTEASVDIHRDLVEEYFQEFHCACVAISGKGSVVSRHALVTNACKLKNFKIRLCWVRLG